jgi:tyrosine-specific transport protein
MQFLAYPVTKLSQHIAIAQSTHIINRIYPSQPSCRSSHRVFALPSDQSNDDSIATSTAPSSPPPRVGRLFSNLGPDRNHEPGSVLGAATLVAGTAVGAGILALPAVCAPAGFAASAAALTAAAGFSIFTGLLVAEVCVNTMCELGSGSGVSLGSMSRRTLGDGGATIVSLTYGLLHYSLLVAYIAKAGETVSTATGFPQPLADIGFTLAMGTLCYASRPNQLDTANSFLVGGVVATFLGLLITAAPGVHFEALTTAHWDEIPAALPVIALAFVFQNVAPVICSSLEGDIVKIRTAIVAGVGVPLVMFLLWDAAVLGSASVNTTIETLGIATTEIAATATTTTAIDPLAAVRGSGPAASILVDGFSLLAVATSFIGFVLGLSEFVAEALGLPVGSGKAIPYAVTLVPPLGLALAFPGLFFKALDFAGTYGVLVLFGLVPVAMVWSERYGESDTLSSREVAPGGKGALVMAGAAAAGVIANQLLF